MGQKNYWDGVYESYEVKKPQYDLWLDKYEDILKKSKNIPIIDLGCGFGNDTLYLKERGYKVISCDISEEALSRLSNFIENPIVKLFDLRDGLPFERCSARVIISDLSLHYFYWDETLRILKEIGRVLTDNGTLLLRVNSTKDINYGAGKGAELEENYYNVDGRLKRFFDRDRLEDLFKEWKIVHIEEYEMNRYKIKKVVFEVAAVHTNGLTE